jgi:hypothetical protein
MAHSWHTITKKWGVLWQFGLIFRQCLDGANTRIMVDCFDAGVIRVKVKRADLIRFCCGMFFIAVPRVCHK